MELNAENLLINWERNQPTKSLLDLNEKEWQSLTTLNTPNKELLKIQSLAEAVLDESPDVLAIVEVMGPHSLGLFNLHFLNDEYDVFYTNTNSNRGIDMGFLVKKTCLYQKEIKSHNNLRVTLSSNVTGRFSRGVSELKLRGQDGKVEFIFLLVHLKSQLSSQKDLNGFDQRKAEIASLVELYKNIQKENVEAKVIITGDFNGWAGFDSPDAEFKVIYEATDLRDVHDLISSTLEERASHVYFNYLGEAQANQLDYIFLNQLGQDAMIKANSYSYRYKYFGYPWPLVKTISERRALPSDHYPQVVVFNLAGQYE